MKAHVLKFYYDALRHKFLFNIKEIRMCKKAFLFLVGVTTFAFDGLENSAKETEKTIQNGIKKISLNKAQPEEENINKIKEN